MILGEWETPNKEVKEIGPAYREEYPEVERRDRRRNPLIEDIS